MITFSTIIPAPAGMLAGIPGQPQPNPSMNLMQDEVVIALSWPVLKTFVSQINEIVNAIEQELGPIKGAKSARSSEQINEEYKNALQRILSD